ncbi:cdc42 homolog [Convolutriloba macropyga]|uniref:cdc42 homolog n=1 Tax=Convolutriloba macropyga TaxID=536237 RepID=UPI003F51FF43
MTLQPSEDANGQGQVKIVVVGDGAVGKTSMIASYATNSFDDDHVPTVYDMYRCQVEVNGKKVKVDIHDTAGQEDYDRTRPIAYPNTTCFVMVYGIDSEVSFDHIQLKWLPEIRHFSKYTYFLLVANKIDRRRDTAPHSLITTQQGKTVAQKVKADGFLECSAKTREGIKVVFDRAIALSLAPPKKIKKKSCRLI